MLPPSMNVKQVSDLPTGKAETGDGDLANYLKRGTAYTCPHLTAI